MRNKAITQASNALSLRAFPEGKATLKIFSMCMQTDRQIVKKGPQQHCSYLFGMLRSTEVTERPVQNTSKWAATVSTHIVGSIQCKIHTEVGRTIEQPHCITWKMTFWVSLWSKHLRWRKIHLHSSPGNLFPGASCLQWKGQGWQCLQGRSGRLR